MQALVKRVGKKSLTLPFLLAPHQSDLIICNEGSAGLSAVYAFNGLV